MALVTLVIGLAAIGAGLYARFVRKVPLNRDSLKDPLYLVAFGLGLLALIGLFGILFRGRTSPNEILMVNGRRLPASRVYRMAQ